MSKHQERAIAHAARIEREKELRRVRRNGRAAKQRFAAWA